MKTINQFVKSSVSELNGEALLKRNVLYLNGVNKEMVTVLKRLHIETIFDLATSRDFNTVLDLIQKKVDKKDGYQNFGNKGLFSKDVFPNGIEVGVDHIPHLSIGKLTFFNKTETEGFRTKLSIETIQEMAFWPPFQNARKILQHAFNLKGDKSKGTDEEIPHDLLPSSGDYPIERVFYKKYFLDTIGNIDAANDGEIVPTSTLESEELLIKAQSERDQLKESLDALKESVDDSKDKKIKEISSERNYVERELKSISISDRVFQEIRSKIKEVEDIERVNKYLSKYLSKLINSKEDYENYLEKLKEVESVKDAYYFVDQLEKEFADKVEGLKERLDFLISSESELREALKQIQEQSSQAHLKYKEAQNKVKKLEDDIKEENKKWVHLETTGPIDIFSNDRLRDGFEEPAVGVEVSVAQSWYVEGVALGQLLHSLALAPGESTRIAIVDWHRKDSSVTQEITSQGEKINSNTKQKRAISEVTQATATELQSGNSSGVSLGGSSQSANNMSGGLLVFSGGNSSSTSSNFGLASNVSRTEGKRDISADTVQNINDSIHQNASSSRTRRAAIVQETFQSEKEQTSTRVITNYNHMHAMSVQYYEVVQIYKVKTEVQDLNRILYLPMRFFDFYDTRVIQRFRSSLLDSALNTQVRRQIENFDAKYSIDFSLANNTSILRKRYLQKIEIKKVDIQKIVDNINEAKTKLNDTERSDDDKKEIKLIIKDLEKTLSKLRADFNQWLRTHRKEFYNQFEIQKAKSKAPIQKAMRILKAAVSSSEAMTTSVSNLSGNVRLESIQFKNEDGIGEDEYIISFDPETYEEQVTKVRDPFTINEVIIHPYPEGTSPKKIQNSNNPENLVSKFLFPDEINDIRDIHSISIKIDKPINNNILVAIEKVATLRFLTDDGKEVDLEYTFIPTFGETKMDFLKINHPYVSADLQNHLDEHREYYSRHIWYRMNSMEYSQVLATVTHKGHKIASFLDPKPVAITGNYIGFRWHFKDETERLEFEDFYQKKSGKQDVTIPLPSGGVFAEAVLGRFNSAEKLDMTRFWNWQDSPIPILPPDIEAIRMGSRNANSAPLPGNLESQAAFLQKLQAMPNPSGLNGTLNAITAANMFRDMSGSQHMAAMLQNSQQLANQGATAAGETNAQNVAAFQEYQSGLAKAYLDFVQKQTETLAPIVAPMIAGAATGGASLGASSVSKAGAVMNMASKMDNESGGQGDEQNHKKSAFQSLIGGAGGFSNLVQKAKGFISKKPSVMPAKEEGEKKE